MFFELGVRWRTLLQGGHSLGVWACIVFRGGLWSGGDQVGAFVGNGTLLQGAIHG